MAFASLSYNVRLALGYTLVYYVATSIATQQVFSSYIYLLTNGSSSRVGYITGIGGLAQVLAAPFAGCLADKYRRDRILRLAGLLGLICAVTSTWGVWQEQYALLCVSQVVLGIYNAFQNPAMEALYADSTPPGHRSKYNTYKYVLLQLAYAGGPLVSCIMFWQLGDNWTVDDCLVVITVGIALSIIPSALCFFFNDDKAIVSPRNAGALKEALLVRPPLTKTQLSADEGGFHRSNGILGRNYVPVVVVITDVMFGLASGMSVKFFPLYFQTELNMGPVMVSVVYTLSPICTSFSSFVAQKTSKRLGRILATICFKLSGIMLLFLMCYLHTIHQTAAAIVPVFIARTALMNSTKPLTRSIIMDCVPKESRAKWNSLESLTMATWAGSAVLGGILVDKWGMNLNNFVTACLQLVSTLPLFFLLGRVPLEKTQRLDHGLIKGSSSLSDDNSSTTGDSDVSSLVLDLDDGMLYLVSPDSPVADEEGTEPLSREGQIERLLKGPYA